MRRREFLNATVATVLGTALIVERVLAQTEKAPRRIADEVIQ